MANLNKHPGVWTSPFAKELHYFDAIHLKGKVPETRRYQAKIDKIRAKHPQLKSYFDRLLNPDFAYTDDWYEHIFSIAPRESVKGECTPLYSVLPIDGIQHVRRLMPNVRIIYLIRDPFDRLMSSYRMQMDRNRTNNGNDLIHLLDQSLFVNRGDYQTNIQRWESVFDPSSIVYIPFGHIKNDPVQVMRTVEKHLMIPELNAYPDLQEAVFPTNKTGKVISTEIIAKMKAMTEPQYAFLSGRFGDEFLANTK